MNILKIKLASILLVSTLILLVTNFNSTGQSFTYDNNDNNYVIKSPVQNNTGLKLTNKWNTDFGGIYGRVYTQGWDKATEIRDETDSPIITIRNSNVGIGTTDPKRKFHVTGWAQFDNKVLIGNLADANDLSMTGYRLFVDRGIITEKVKCAIKTTTDWSDYVFEEDYERMPLDELEDFVTENKHLPKVPSAEEMVENGLDVAKMDAKLLEKIEEAYLYIIDMNKEMEAMNEKVEALANENQSLKSSLQSLSAAGK